MYLYNKNILEYANIVVTGSNFRILYTEDHSNIQFPFKYYCALKYINKNVKNCRFGIGEFYFKENSFFVEKVSK